MTILRSPVKRSVFFLSSFFNFGKTIRNEVQPSKAFQPIFFTELGITISCKDVQPPKAASSISFTELGITIFCKYVQFSKAR